VKQRIERVLTWAKDGMPLPQPSAGKRVEHHAALAWQALPAFMERLRALVSTSAQRTGRGAAQATLTNAAGGRRYTLSRLRQDVQRRACGRRGVQPPLTCSASAQAAQRR
jgi:hypothetical protein